MALRYSKTSVTKASNALEELMDDSKIKLAIYQELDEEEIVVHQKDIQKFLNQFDQKLKNLDLAMDKFTRDVDTLDETDEEAQKKSDEIITKTADLVDEAHKTRDFLELEFERSTQMKIKKDPNPISHAEPNGSDSSTAQTANQSLFRQQEPKLDNVKIPKFKGNRWEFENFWTLYHTFVDSTPIPNLWKFTHLLNSLEGEPKELISRFKMSSDNYPLAVELLKKKYNNPEQIISDLTSQLQKDSAKSDSISDQRKLFDRIFIVTAQLKEYQENIETRMFKDEIIQKFSKKIKEEIFKKKIEMGQEGNKWTLDQILHDLDITITKEEELNKLMKRNESDSNDTKSKGHSTKKDSKSDSKPPKKCVYCKLDGHWGSNCRTHPTAKERSDILKAENRCLKCTKLGHQSDSCKAKACSNCNKDHHFSVCFKQKKEHDSNNQKKSEWSKDTDKSKQQKAKTQAVVHSESVKTDENDSPANGEKVEMEKPTATTIKKGLTAFIPTLQATAFNQNSNDWEAVSVMLDCGSDQTYATESLVKKWDLPDHGEETFRIRTFGSSEAQTCKYGKSEIRLKIGDQEMDMEVFVSAHLAGRVAKAQLTQEDMNFVLKKRLLLNEDALETIVEPQLIIGCDYMGDLLTGELIPLPSGINIIGTALGYTTLGKMKSKIHQDKESDEKHLYMALESSEADQLRKVEEIQMLDMQMKLANEFTGPVSEEQSAADKKTVEFFNKTVEKREEGYFVRLPFKENHPPLPDNYSIALRRLQSVKKQYSEEVLKMIDDVFQDQKEKKIIEEVSDKDIASGLIHYNPTQPVITPHKTTTKCRVVVDGSAHFKDNLAINGIIEQGPVILPDLVDMLIRFRAGKTVIISDVEKAFLQVFLHEEDRDVTRVLWLRDFTKPVTKDNIVIYRFSRVLFGLNVSPFLLAATILHHLEKQSDKKLAKEMANNLYVDNLVITTDLDEEEAIKIYRTIKNIFAEMNMNLREFLSNSDIFNKMVDEADRATEETMKVLGITWTSAQDEIVMKASMDLNKKSSRRTVSSAIASIFDPLGLLVPLLLQLKLFQRQLWTGSYQWDTPLSKDHEEKWNQAVQDIQDFTVNLPRNVIEKSDSNTIVTFTDASMEATACAVYIVNKKGSNLLFGKSQVKPLKETWTVPKLETQAMKMGTEKTLKVLKSLQDGDINVDKVIIMTDSTIALDWLRSNPGKKENGVFITNRLTAIRKAVSEMEESGVEVQFGHVSTDENPADLGTRGVTKETFFDTIWWKGPKFLQSDNWMDGRQFFRVKNEGYHQMNAIINDPEDSHEVFDCNITNDLGRMIRSGAFTLKFVKVASNNLSDETKTRMAKNIPFLQEENTPGTINGQQIKAAEITLLKDQQKNFSPKQLQKLKNLGLVKNSNGLIVCKGRMELAELDEDAKSPILVLPNTAIARQIILSSHGKFHASMEQTMDNVRRKCWMPKLRQQVKAMIARCVICQKKNKQPCRYPEMARLPGSRVKITRPFKTIGLDNFGPIPYFKEDGTKGEAYGTIFTCSVTRLVHVEMVTDKSAFQFIQALRRLVAARGLPEKIVSDNGLNFVLGQKIIEEAMKRSDTPENIRTIEWEFITPYSPWKGGLYERMVRSVKHTFSKAVGRKILSLDELITTFHEVAASVNSRPLTYVEDDINSDYPIRPIDFVSQEMKLTLPLEAALDASDDYLPPGELRSNETKLSTIEALKSSVEATEKVWKIWQTKYLAELREHHKLRMDSKRGSLKLPTMGQVVLVCDEDQPRNSWKLGRITKLNTSSDGVIREVELLVLSKETFKRSTLRRSINMVVPLEMDMEPENEIQTPPVEDKEVDEIQTPPVEDKEVDEIQTPPVEDKEVEDKEVEEPEGRYNLRKRKEVNYDEEAPTQRGFAFTTSLAPVITLMMTMLLITGASADPVKLNCNSQGLQIYGQYESFEACSEIYCTSKTRYTWTQTGKKDIWLPTDIKIHPYHSTIKVNDGTTMKVFELDCPAIPFCETIDCTFCLSNILNPECHMSFAILGLGALLFVLLMLIHMICHVPVTLGAPFKMAWTILKGIWIVGGKTFTWISRYCRRNRQRRTRWREMMVIILLLIVIESVQSCQEVDIITQFETVCNTEGKCNTFTEEVMHLNQIHNEGCLRIEKNGTILRDIRIQLLEVELHCVKRTVTYTQDIATKVWSAKRCPHMGSCKGEKCSNITRESIIPELDIVNKYVGNTGCAESCGGVGCGCFYLSSGCLFYRTYALPRSTEAIEVFDCMDYQPMAKIRMTVTTLNSWKNSAETLEMLSPIGRTTSFMEIAVTVDTITTPPSPALNSWFIRRNSSMATWTQGLMPNFQCDRFLKKCILEEQCQCSPAENRMQCTCKDIDIEEHFRQTDKHFPIQSGHLRFESDQDSVKGRIKTASTATLSLKMTDKWKTSIVKSAEICTVSNTHAKGCYSCEKGATAEITCHSTSEDTMANVECGEEAFTIPCSTKGTTSNVTFHANYAKFRRQCTLDCGGKKKENFEITGILKYSGSVWTSLYHLLDGNTTIYNEINLPDMGHLMESYFTYMKTVLSVILLVGIIFLLTYSMITKTGISIMKAIVQILLAVICLPIRFIQRRRRHGHLHILVCMILACPTIPCEILGKENQQPLIAESIMDTNKMPTVVPKEQAFQTMMNDIAGKINVSLEEMLRDDTDAHKLVITKTNIIKQLNRTWPKERDAVTGQLCRKEMDLHNQLDDIKDTLTGLYFSYDCAASSCEESMSRAVFLYEHKLFEPEDVYNLLDERGIHPHRIRENIKKTKAFLQFHTAEILQITKQPKLKNQKLMENAEPLARIVISKLFQIGDQIKSTTPPLKETKEAQNQTYFRDRNNQQIKSSEPMKETKEAYSQTSSFEKPPASSPTKEDPPSKKRRMDESEVRKDRRDRQDNFKKERKDISEKERKDISKNGHKDIPEKDSKTDSKSGSGGQKQVTRLIWEKNVSDDTHIQCSFCKYTHYSDMCGNVTEADNRRSILTQNGRCHNCLSVRVYGRPHKCHSKVCVYCGKPNHHRSICERPVNKVKKLTEED